MFSKLWKNCLFFGMIILFILVSVIPSTGRVEKSQGNRVILYVGGDGPGNFTTIQYAIDNSTEGDTIYVYNISSPYCEHLQINKSINLLGQNQASTIIDGENSDTIILIESDNVIINNFSICSSGGFDNNAGISVNSNNVRIINCTIQRTRTGIILENCNNSIFKYCNIHSNGEGFSALCSYNFLIYQCQFCHNAIGLRINNSSICTIKNSYFHTNGFGCYFDNANDILIKHCALNDNNDNQGGAYIINSKNIIFNDSNICHNGVGLIICNSDSLKISHCNINWNTKRAVFLKGDCDNVSIFSNEICNNFHYGIHTASSITLHNNNFYENAIHALYSTDSCDATSNWWNSIFGPAYTFFGPGELINRNIRKIRRFPWLLHPMQNAGADWNTSDEFIKLHVSPIKSIINISGNDTDNDMAPDWWEIKWGYNPNQWDNHQIIDKDHDGLTNLEECYTDQWGSNPFKKDIFIEIDWMETHGKKSNQPDENLINKAKNVFERHNISLHIDVGDMGGGELIPHQDLPDFIDFRNLYWNYFLHNDLNNPRKGIFHYGIISDDGEAGYAIFGWDQLDFFTIGAEQLQKSYPYYSKGHLIMHGTLHELGHGLGLFGDTFGGIDNRESIKFTSLETWKYINYRSCMNYHYTFSILGYSDGTHGIRDFNDWDNLNLSMFKNTSFNFNS